MLTAPQLLRMLTEEFGLDPAETHGDTPLFSAGRLDSFHLVDLMTQLETRTGTRIKPGELTLENFDTVDRLVAFLSRKILPKS